MLRKWKKTCSVRAYCLMSPLLKGKNCIIIAPSLWLRHPTNWVHQSMFLGKITLLIYAFAMCIHTYMPAQCTCLVLASRDNKTISGTKIRAFRTFVRLRAAETQWETFLINVIFSLSPSRNGFHPASARWLWLSNERDNRQWWCSDDNDEEYHTNAIYRNVAQISCEIWLLLMLWGIIISYNSCNLYDRKYKCC